MKYFSLLIVATLFFGCMKYDKDTDKTTYLNKGDYWINCYANLHISRSNIVYKDNRLYCSTMNGLNNSEIFYCLDLVSGKVLWANQVSNRASFNPIVLDDIIYYVSYLADRYAFDISGNEVWHKNLYPKNLISGNFTANVINHNLIVSDIQNGFYEFEKSTGDLIQATTIEGWKRTSFLPVHTDKYMYYTISSDSIKNSPNPKAGTQLICRNLMDTQTIWQIPITHAGSGLYERDGNIYFFNNNTVYSVNGSDGSENWIKYLGPNTYIDQHWHYSGFMQDQIQVQTNDSTFLAVDYKSGNIIPYYTKLNVFNYIIKDNLRKKYNVQIIVGSFRGNNNFEDTAEVKVEMIEDKK